jgi:hypothetical protein
MVEEGKPAPDFELATDTGERVKLSDFGSAARGRGSAPEWLGHEAED